MADLEQTLVYPLHLCLTEAFQKTTLCGGQRGGKPQNTTPLMSHRRTPRTGQVAVRACAQGMPAPLWA